MGLLGTYQGKIKKNLKNLDLWKNQSTMLMSLGQFFKQKPIFEVTVP